jgi:DNA invertase Pin-like site-specific DNA recombinase
MIVGYIRVSTLKQLPQNQREELGRYAEENHFSIDKWVVETVSGKKEIKGRKLGKLVKNLGKGDTIIVTEISRLSRSLTDLMGLMGRCLEKGINILTTKEKYKFDDSINSKVLCFAFGLVAEIERNLISMRTKEALAARKAAGKSLGRKKGFSPKMSLLEGQEKVISQMLSEGKTNKEIYSTLGVSKSTFQSFKRKNFS